MSLRGMLRLYKICTMTARLLVSTRAGDTEYFQLRNGLHQECALSPLFSTLIMEVPKGRYRKGATMGDVVCG